MVYVGVGTSNKNKLCILESSFKMVLMTIHLLCLKMNLFVSSVAALWIMAAKWEMETQLSSESARHLFLRALRFHPECPKLYQEVSSWFSSTTSYLIDQSKSVQHIVQISLRKLEKTCFPISGEMLSKRFKKEKKYFVLVAFISCLANHVFMYAEWGLYSCLLINVSEFPFKVLEALLGHSSLD